eukprot:8913804-Pyramimonas_sp.AAC.2
MTDRLAHFKYSDWSPSRVYSLVPPPVGPRPGYILLRRGRWGTGGWGPPTRRASAPPAGGC